MNYLNKNNKVKINTYERIVECPKCNSINTFIVNSIASASISSLILCLLLLCICVWFPSIGWQIGPYIFLMAICSIILFFISGFTKNYTLICKKCNNKYKINKKEYKESIKDQLHN